MAHPQNSPRGLFAKNRIDLGSNQITNASSGLKFNLGLALSGGTDYITANSTATVLPTGLALSAQSDYFTANSTAPLIFPSTAVLPSTRVVGGLVFVSNSTGKMLAYHSTGTTWKYASATSVLA